MAKQFVWDPSFWMKKAEKAIDAGRKTVTDIAYEVRAIRDRDPAARSNAEVLLLYPGLHAVLAHRAAHYLHGKKHFFAARAISQVARGLTGIEIHPGAKIGKGVFIDHGCAVVIGETAEVGDNCTIYQGVTLGGTGKHCGKRHPTLGSDVMVGAGAKVLGPFKVGDHAKIAAGAVVLKEVPSDSTAVGIPAKIVNSASKSGAENLDQINVPDPVAQELTALKERVAELERRLAADSQPS
ncbi:MAG: serine O-acetyltransferase EpsC [Candidatus Woodwardiibium sp.]